MTATGRRTPNAAELNPILAALYGLSDRLSDYSYTADDLELATALGDWWEARRVRQQRDILLEACREYVRRPSSGTIQDALRRIEDGALPEPEAARTLGGHTDSPRGH